MLIIWIVWSDRPLAVFSSEARARAYIERQGAVDRWTCSAAQINAENPVETRWNPFQASAAHPLHAFETH